MKKDNLIVPYYPAKGRPSLKSTCAVVRIRSNLSEAYRLQRSTENRDQPNLLISLTIFTFDIQLFPNIY